MYKMLVIRKAFRYRVYPTVEQEARLRQWEGAQRFLWNLAHEQRLMGLARPNGEKRYPTAFDQINELKPLRAEHDWLADVPRDSQAQLLVELDKAWQRCFKRLGDKPRFKSRGGRPIGLCEPHPKAFRVGNECIHFPKLGQISTVIHRPLEGRPKTCTLVREVDQWFVAISCEVEMPEPKPRSEPRVALDRGVANLVADSNGKLIANPRHLRQAQQQLARAQRTVSRKKKGSRNRAKARLRVARLHRKVRRQRQHLLHVLSHRYAESQGTVVVEDLRVRNMTRSASGTTEAPGQNVAAKAGLNRAILDAGWSQFVWMLEYKLAWSGGRLLKVPPQYSSQTCAECGHVDAASRVTQARFVCTKCGHEGHADVNAARVLLSRGNHGGAVCGGSAVGRPVKQKLRVARRGTRSVGHGFAASPYLHKASSFRAR
jgi:putative transposase